MQFFLLRISLILIPLCLAVGFFPILPETVTEYLRAKDFLALFFAGIISFSYLLEGSFKKQKLIWINILLFYIILNQFLVPPLELYSDDPMKRILSKVVADLWGYKPLSFILIYYLFFLTIQEVVTSALSKELIMKTLMWIGYISAGYVIFQALGMDPYQQINNIQGSRLTTSNNLTSFMTHPNYSGSFIAICIPFAIYFKKYWKMVTMIVTVFLTKCCFAIGAMTAGILFYIWVKSKNSKYELAVNVFILCTLISGISICHIHHFNDHGRTEVWFQMYEDLKSRPFFGYGLGSFPVLFPLWHHRNWYQAHNEVLQFCFETGYVGGFILLSAIFSFTKSAIEKHQNNDILLALTSSFIIILMSSIGLFVWQIEPHRYISVVIAGLIISFL